MEATILGSRIREVRKLRGMSQQRLASAADLAINTIALLEQGKSEQIRSGPLIKIADILDVSIDYLTGRTNKMDYEKAA